MHTILNINHNTSHAALPLFLTAAAVLSILFFTGPVDVCADPALLAPGIVPNLLIIMDNSESMLDLAYIPDNGACHDSMETTDTEAAGQAGYDSATTYAGYFSSNGWYAYDSKQARFEPVAKPLNCSGTGHSAYTHPQTSLGELCLHINTDAPGFNARGNLLIWVMTSRFDIETKVLTGG